MAAIAELKAIASLDGKKFDAEVKRIGSSVDKFGAGLSQLKGLIAGAFTIGAVVSFGRKLLATADDLQTAANTFDVSLESMIAFKSAMAESGIGADRFMRIFGKLNSSISEAQRGVKTYTDAFDMMGVSQRELIGLGMDEVMALMATKYEAAGDKAQFLAGVSKAFGERIGPQLIEVFQRLNTEGLDEFKKSAEGAADGIAELAKASDRLEKLGDDAIVWSAKTVGAIDLVIQKMADMQVQEEIAGKRPSFWERLLAGAGPVGALAGAGLYIKKLFDHEMTPEPEAPAAGAEAEEKKAAALSAYDAAEREERLDREMTAEEKRIAQRYEAIEAMKREDAAATKLADSRSKLEEQKIEEQKAGGEAWGDALAGKGIPTPGMARVDSLQSIGGLVGGAAGRGDQAARIAERQASIQEAIREIVAEHSRKLDAIDKKLGELGDG
jgi:hypothetical protein